MADKCANMKAAAASLKAEDNDRLNKIESEMDQVIGQSAVHYALKEVDSEFKKSGNKEPTEKELNDAFRKHYKGKNLKKALIVAKILGTLKNNDIRRKKILSDIFFENLKELKKGKLNPSKIQQAGGLVDMMSLNDAFLKRIYWRSWNWSKNTKKFDTFVGRNFRVPLMRPRNLAYKDASGSFRIMEKSVSEYLSRVLLHHSRFWGGWAERGRDYGMEDIEREVAALGDTIHGQNIDKRDARDYFTDFFAVLNRGWIKDIVDQKTQETTFVIHNEYSPDLKPGEFDKRGGDEELRKERYEESGDVVFSWKNPIVIEKFDPVKHKDLDPRVQEFLQRTVIMSPMYKKALMDNRKKAVGIHDEVYKYLNGDIIQGKPTNTGAFQKSKEALINELQEWFKIPGAGGQQYDYRMVAKAVFDDKNEGIPYSLRKIIKELEPFTKYNIFETMFMDTKEMGYKGGYLPLQFDPYRSVFQLYARLDELKAKSKKSKETLEAKMPDEEYKQRLAEHKGYLAAVSRIEKNIAKIQNMPNDQSTGHLLNVRRDSVHMKHISNSFDPMEMRTDTETYSTYLSNNFTTVERNFMTAELLKALRQAKQIQDPNESAAVKQAVVSLFQSTSQDPEARTKLPIVGLDVSPAKVANFFNKMPVNISPELLSRYTMLINKWVAGRYLQGWTTAAVNFGQMQQKFIDTGYRNMMDSWDYYNEREHEPGLIRLLKNSGVTQFKDYFSEALIGEMDSLENGRDKAFALIGAMEKFNKVKDKYPGDGTKINEAYEDYVSTMKKVLGKTPTGLATKTKSGESRYFAGPLVLKAEELKKLKPALKIRAINEMLNKFANYAINKTYTKKPSKNPIVNSLKGAGELYAKAQKAFLPTMGGTEAKSRSISFLMGVQAYLDMMELPIQPHQLIDKVMSSSTENEKRMYRKHYKLAVMAGRRFTSDFDFELEVSGYGEANRTPIGRLALRFTTFGQQKFGKDAEVIFYGYLSEKEIDELHRGRGAKVVKFFKDSLTGSSLAIPGSKKAKKLNMENRDIAALRRFYMQGIATVLFDFLFINPLLIKGVRTMAGDSVLGRAMSFGAQAATVGIGGGGRKLAGMTSDLVSLASLVPMMIAKYTLFGGHEDDEDLEKDVRYYLRRTFAGIGTMWTTDHALWLMAEIASNDPKKLARRRKAMLSYYTPGQAPQKFMEMAIDAFTKK